MIDNYPLPVIPPLELVQKSFTAIVDFGFDLDTFTGSSVTFTSSTAGAGSGSGLSGRDLKPIDSDTETSVSSSSVSLSGDLASVLREAAAEETRIVYTAYSNRGVFAEREEFAEENNRSSFVVGSVLFLEARLTGGTVVSGLSGVVTLSFEKTQEVWHTR